MCGEGREWGTLDKKGAERGRSHKSKKRQGFFVQAQAVMVNSVLIVLQKKSAANHEAKHLSTLNSMKSKQETNFAFLN